MRSPASKRTRLRCSVCASRALPPTFPAVHPSRLTVPASHRPTACTAELPADRGRPGRCPGELLVGGTPVDASRHRLPEALALWVVESRD